jgi:hypothetical protein
MKVFIVMRFRRIYAFSLPLQAFWGESGGKGHGSKVLFVTGSGLFNPLLYLDAGGLDSGAFHLAVYDESRCLRHAEAPYFIKVLHIFNIRGDAFFLQDVDHGRFQLVAGDTGPPEDANGQPRGLGSFQLEVASVFSQQCPFVRFHGLGRDIVLPADLVIEEADRLAFGNLFAGELGEGDLKAKEADGNIADPDGFLQSSVHRFFPFLQLTKMLTNAGRYKQYNSLIVSGKVGGPGKIISPGPAGQPGGI